MNLRHITGLALALCVSGAIASQAQAASATQEIMHKPTFREGLVWVGSDEPGEAENQELVQVLDHLHDASWTTRLDKFLQRHTASPWAASLHYDYASFCRRTGRTTKALEQFEAAWALVKGDSTPQGQRLGGAILANWTDLLSSLGRLEQLGELVAEGDQWHFGEARDRSKFEGAKNSLHLMRSHPEIAYRCGTFALKAVGEALQQSNLENLVEVPSPTNGFSMAGLADLAKQHGLDLVPVRRTAGQGLIVPSIVHWRQNHYAAILSQKGDSYLVTDPTFGGNKWLPADVIDEESSGEFLVPAAMRTNGWTELAHNQAALIHGMGLPNNVKDGKDRSCKRDFSGATVCIPCHGMPVWWVSEPYVNVWIADQPISYLTSRGEPFTFQVTYKQRDTRPSPADGIISTAGWNNSWASYVRLDSSETCSSFGGCTAQLSSSAAIVFLPNGGEVDFAEGQSYDQETRLLLEQQTPELSMGGGTDNGDNGLRLVHADGSQDIYGLGIGISSVYGEAPESDFLLTRHIDTHGDTTWFQYDSVNLSAYVLTYVVDPDGLTNFLTYTSGNLLSSVTNAYGLSAHFGYDSSGNLNSIVDAQGLSSSLTYNTNGYPTSLITPYGTNVFSIYANSTVASTNDAEGNFGGDSSPYIDRAVLVTDPTGANYQYLYQYDCSTLMSTAYSSSSVPTNTPLGTLDTGASGTNILTGTCYRNSFYWGPRQYPGLSTTNIFSLSANDFLRGRMRHWLEDTNQLYLSDNLSAEQDPSPDGSAAGLLTFYDYQGKLTGYDFCAGTNALPSVKAWRLPGGETHYEYLRFDYFGNITNQVTTYTTASGVWGTRTNQFVYTNNTATYVLGTWTGSSIINTVSSTYTVPNLLTKVIGADGNTIWSFGGFDTVTWTNFFYTGTQTNGTTLTLSRVLPDYATNGVGQVAVATYTSAGRPVNYYDMFPGGTGGTNYSYGTLLDTTFPGFDKVTSLTTVAGLTVTNFYNTSGFLTRAIDLQILRTNSFAYGSDGLVSVRTNELGLVLDYTWDNLLRLTSLRFPDGTYVSNLFDKLDLGGRQDRLGHWTYYAYDGARHLVAVTNANQAVTSFSWCGCGELTAITDALTNQTTLNYDYQGNLTNIAFPDLSSLNYQYDLAQRVTSMSDGAGRSFHYLYDNQGFVSTVSNAYAQTAGSMVYDIRDRQQIFTDANEVTVTNVYDNLDRIISRTWQDGIGEGYLWASNGLAAYTNRDNQVTHFTRDVATRLTAVTNANTEVVQFAYNPASEITNLVDGLTHTTTWQYNQNGWVTNKLDGLGRIAFQFAYNANGWVTNRWTPEKGNTAYTHDNVGNLTVVAYPQLTNSYGYDADNRLTNVTDAVGATAFAYTKAGRLASETGPWTNDALSYLYSQMLRTNMTITSPSSSWSQNYSCDAAWRLIDLTSPAGAFGYAYDFQPASYLVTGISLPNGSSITNAYDTLAHLTQTSLNNYWGHPLDAYEYQHDPLGLRTNITRFFGLGTNSAAVGYDNIGQLTSWNAKESSGLSRLNEQLAFGYDAAHNLYSRTNEALSQAFGVDAANELTAVTRSGTFTLNGAIPAPATNITVNGSAAQTYADLTFASTNNALTNGINTFTIIGRNVYGTNVTNTASVNLPTSVSLSYDNNGNLTNDGTRSFAYDAENRLTNVTVASNWKSDFVYDGLNRRRIERDFGWISGGWLETNETHYIYDGWLLLQERDSNNVVRVTYTRGLDLSGSRTGAGGIGGLLSRTDTNSSTFYHSDGEGNVTALIDSQEDIVARYLYNPFGKLLGQWGTLASANKMQFSSMPYHVNSGLSLYPLRPYDSGLQRWLTEDPVRELGGINLYGFAANNAIVNIDPYGLFVPPGTPSVVATLLSSAETATAAGAAAGAGDVIGPAALAVVAVPVVAVAAVGVVNGLNMPPSPVNYPGMMNGGNPIPTSITGYTLGPGEYIDQDGNIRDQYGNKVRDKSGRDVGPKNPQQPKCKILQSGGNTLKPSTANALDNSFGTDPGEVDWGQALEDLKQDNGVPNNFHSTSIYDNGNVVLTQTLGNSPAGTVIGNLGDYIP